MTRFWPQDTIVARAVVSVLAAMLVLSCGAIAIYYFRIERTINDARREELVDRIANLAQRLQAAPGAEERQQIAQTSSSVAFEAAYLLRRPDGRAATPAGAPLELQRALSRALSPRGVERVDIRYVDNMAEAGDHIPDHVFEVIVRLDERSWLMVRAHTFEISAQAHGASLLAFALAGLAIALIAAIVLRWVTVPLRTFAQAAEQFQLDDDSQPLREEGPVEVRAAAQAMNAMQSRIRDLLRQRTLALAALSHDLRTPITRMSMRSELVTDDAWRAQTQADLAEMLAMIEATLAYLKGAAPRDEDKRLLDVASIVETVCDELQDSGAKISVSRSAPTYVYGHPLALKRAIRNLVENAVFYGAPPVVVALEVNGGRAVLNITDRGPGIPPARMNEVLEPFVRLEESRNRRTGGAGLGLTIALDEFRAHNGDLTLNNRRGGGLRIVARLPIATSRSQR